MGLWNLVKRWLSDKVHLHSFKRIAISSGETMYLVECIGCKKREMREVPYDWNWKPIHQQVLGSGGAQAPLAQAPSNTNLEGEVVRRDGDSAWLRVWGPGLPDSWHAGTPIGPLPTSLDAWK